MSFVMLALMFTLAAATIIVLADSGLRLWSAIGEIKQAVAKERRVERLPSSQRLCFGVNTRVSYARVASMQPAPLRVAA